MHLVHPPALRALPLTLQIIDHFLGGSLKDEVMKILPVRGLCDSKILSQDARWQKQSWLGPEPDRFSYILPAPTKSICSTQLASAIMNCPATACSPRTPSSCLCCTPGCRSRR